MPTQYQIYDVYAISEFTGKEELFMRVELSECIKANFIRQFYMKTKSTFSKMIPSKFDNNHPLVKLGMVKIYKLKVSNRKIDFYDLLASKAV